MKKENGSLDYDDMIRMDDLTEENILQNMEQRYNRNKVYTYCGSIIISINPYQMYKELYSEENLKRYINKPLGELEPHVFAIADKAYRNLQKDNKSQSLIITGESGAGKSQTTHFILKYYSLISNSNTDIEKKIIMAAELLDTFGNAKTIRNNNSSRFGKYFKIKFRMDFSIAGAEISTFLLEKTRISHQQTDERNYHIFYQMCAGMSNQERDKYKISNNPLDYNYLKTCITCPDRFDEQGDYKKTITLLGKLGLKDNEIDFIFKVLSSVLHLGNVNFTEKGGIDVDDDNLIDLVSSLLELETSKLKEAMLSKSIIVNGNQIIKKPLTLKEANDSRDTLCRYLYFFLFEWIVKRLNGCLESQGELSSLFLGVLDIFGFENFESNSFEQFCINYANEKLQQQFVREVFEMEQIEYKREGIKWSNIEFSDNKDCIQMIEKSNISILSLLDEATKLESSSDENFTENLKKYFGKNDKFSTTRLKKNQFSLRHFAEEVTYDVNGFREKNQNQIRPDLIGVIKVSGCELISDLFKEYLSLEEIINSNTRKFRGKTTVSTQFKRELLGLENVLNSTHSFYVRCIKPNNKQLPKQFDLEFVRKQLIYNGMLETVKIRKSGLPFRFSFTIFYNRYRKLSRLKSLPKNVDTRKACLLLVQKIGEYIIEGRYALGKTKIFLGNDQYEKLESARAEFLEKSSYIIRRAVTKWMERKEEEERKRKEEEERLRKEEEERKRKEEEERKKREEEERKRKEEAEKKRKEELRKKKEEEERLKKEQEEKKKREEEERLKKVELESKEEEERKRKEEIRLKKEKEEEEKAKIEEERIIKKQEELRKRKEEEIRKKKEELERKKKELTLKNSQGVEDDKRKQVENKILEHKNGFDKEPLGDEEIKKSLSELLQHIKKWAQLALKKTDRKFLLVPQKSIGNLVTTLYLNSPVKRLGTNLVNCVKKILACKETLYDDVTPSETKSKMLQDEIKNIVLVTKEFVEYLDKRNGGTSGDSLSKSSSMDFLSKSSTTMDILKSDSSNELLNISGKSSVGIESRSDGSLLNKSSGLTNKSSVDIPQKSLTKNYKVPAKTTPLKNSSSSSAIVNNGNKNGLAKSSNGVGLGKNSNGVMNNNSTGLRNNSKFKDNIFLNLSKSGESENSENNLGFSLKKSLTPEVGSKTGNNEVSSSDSNISFLISPRNSKSNISGVKTQDNKKLLKDPQKSSQSHIYHQNTSAKRSEFVFRKKDSDDMDDPIIISQKLEKEKDKENNSDVENTPVFVKKPSIRRSLSTPSLEKMMLNQGGGNNRESSSSVDDYPKLKHYFRDSPTLKSDITSLLQSMVHPLKGIPLSTRRNGFKIYKDTFTFISAVEWLSKQTSICKDKQSSVSLFVCLQQDGLVQLVLKNKKTANDDVYHFTQATTEIPSSSDQNSLEQQLERQKEKYPQLYVPRILQVLTSMIESICSKNKSTTVCSNIFCQGVGEFLLLPYQKSLDNDQPLDTTDPHIPANLLKQWLWKLPKPLIPIKLIDCQKYIYLSPEDRLKYLIQLPLVNKDALSELFEFFVNCSKWESFTKVTLSEICRQFTPCLLHCKAETNKTIFECLKTCDSSEFQLIELLIKEIDPKQLKSKREITPTTSFIPNQRSERKITFLGPLIGNFPSPFTRNKSQIVIPEEHKSWLKEPELLKSSTWSKYACGNCGKEAPHHAFEKCASCGEAFYSINKTPLNLLFEKKIGYQYELGTHTISPDLQPIENGRLKREDIDLDCHYYRDYFFGKPHSIFMGENKTKDIAEYCCVTVENSEGKSLKVLILSKLGWKKTSIVASSKNQRIISQLNKIDFLAGFKFSSIEDSESLKKVLLEYETRSIATGYKFGVLYQKEGQKIEEDMYGNVKGSVRYVQFLKLLGTVINLEGHVGFRGGLDVKNNSTGTKSIYKKMYFDENSYLIEDKLQQKTPKEEWKTFEIMYHVSTLLPYSPENPQQLHRKRHIGNDVIVIVFKEKNEDRFDPSILASHFNHVFIVVTPHTINEQGLATQYHIGIASKVGVKPFRPFIKQPPIYDINDDLINLLIMKAINGERAAMYSRDFSVNLNRTRSEVLKSWFGTYK